MIFSWLTIELVKCSLNLYFSYTVIVLNSGLPKAVEISHKNMNSQLESINVSGKFKDILKEESVEHAAIVSVLSH